MKKRGLLGLLTICLLLLCSGCGKSNISKITLSQLKERIEQKDTFILEVTKTGCSACEDFAPRFDKILVKNDIQASSINLADFTEKEQEELDEIISVSGTPTVIFFKKGIEETTLHRMVGAVEDETIISKLKTHNYIKK